MQPIKSILIFCDGACSGNPGPGGWGVIVVTPDGRVTEIAGYQDPTTNNQMEIFAAYRALESVQSLSGPVDIYTDSTYVINGITKWIFGWMRKGWISSEGKDVANRELWEKLLRVTSARGKSNPISWKYVRGHTGVAGNDRVDEIAVAYSKRLPIDLYDGKVESYEVPVFDIPKTSDKAPEKKSKSGSKSAAYSYVSLVDNEARRHKTWADCESRVKGKSGAKFKKSVSVEDEAAILESWGVSLKN